MQRKWRRSWARSKSWQDTKPFQEITPWKTLAKRLLPPLAAASFLLSSIATAYALPTDVVTEAGKVTVSQSGNTMTVNETSATGIVSSRTFVINADETLNIFQPSSSATLLWKVLGDDPSAIYGHVNANGQLFLYNPQGTLFARGAEFNGGSLVATSLNISDSDFLSGNYTFSGSSTNGAIINQGTLTAANGGYIALLGPQVTNEGIIVAQQGTVALGAGSAVTLDMDGDGLLNLAVDKAAVDASAANHNLIQADGGQVIMTASTAGDLTRTAVNNSGTILARSAKEVNGVIRLDAGTDGKVVNSGTLDVSGKGTDETGGTVKVLGNTVTLADGTQIDAGGDSGGGTVLVGGNYQGQGTEQNANTTTVASTAVINADAITQGNGGKVVVWSDGTTNYGGTISARGGSVSGDGGIVETSGKQTLLMTGNVNAGAFNGNSGSWLLDPTNYTIDATAAANIATSLNNGTNVTITTSGSGADAGDITVANAVSWTSGNTLTLKADNDIDVNNTITSTGSGNVVLRADSDANSSGTVGFGTSGKVVTDGTVSIYYNPGGTTTVSINGTDTTVKDYTKPTDYTSYVKKTSGATGNLTAYMLVNNLNELQAISVNTSGTYALGKDIDASTTSTWNSGAGFTPIGSFSGILDGDGHAISGLYINDATDTYVGLIGYVDSGTIRNLGLENVDINSGKGGQRVGGLAGGVSGGSITDSYVTGAVTGCLSSASANVGGLAGFIENGGTITNSYSTAVVQGYAASNIGGLVGENSGGTITGSYSSGAVTGSGSGSNIGGLVGNNWVGWGYDGSNELAGKISGSYSSGAVTSSGSSSCAGGLVGNNGGGTISGSYSSGAVTNSGSSSYAGGLVGNFGGKISDSYSSGAVTGTGSGSYVGGLVGYHSGYSSISGSYSSGAVISTGSGSYAGGFVGRTNDANAITTSYWDSDSSGQQSGSGDGSSIAGLTKLSASDKDPYSESSYSGFDFGTTWYMIDGSTRPFLRSEYSTTITNGHQLQLMAMDLSAAYTLAGNIDLSGFDMGRNGCFVPIGASSTSAFSGSLDGNGYAVNNLTINGSTADAVGLFGYIGQSGSVSNIGLYDGNVTGGANNTYVGSLAGYNAGSITNAYSTGKVSGGGTVGGLVGLNNGTVQTSYTTSQVTATGGSGTAGGMVGENEGQISNVYSSGKVSGAASNTLGGLAGTTGTGSSIANAYWDTTTSGQASGVGSGSSTGVTGLTTAQMMNKNYLAGLGFDFDKTWYMVDGSTRPFLRSENVTTISNAHQLQLMGANLSAAYILGSDVDLSELKDASGMWNTTTGFAPVGSSSTPFAGALDGKGHTINGLMINNTALTTAGLFGYIKDAVISNISLSNASITAGNGSYAGGLAGESDGGTITDVYFSGTVTSSGTAGGLVGLNTGSISNSYSTGTVSISGDGSVAGGLAGSNTGIISGSYNAGTVSGSGTDEQVGGVAGTNTGSITGSYNAAGGVVSVSSDGSMAGGVAGSNTGTISSSYNAGTVSGSGTDEQVGGVAGTNTGSITNSYNFGTVSGSGTAEQVGGVAGTNAGSIGSSYNAGTVSGSGPNEQVGGVAGINTGSILCSYGAAAAVVSSTANGNNIGGVTGENAGSIIGSFNNGAVTTTTGASNNKAGGVVGFNTTTGSLYKSYNTGTVSAGGDNSSVGGLVGENAGSITSSTNSGAITAGGSTSPVGGLIGVNSSTGKVTTSFSVGNVSGKDRVGGLVGDNAGSITDAYFAVGTATGSGSASKTGGLAGVSSGTITTSFSSGGVTGDGLAGGLVGERTGGTIMAAVWDVDKSGQQYGVGSDPAAAGVTGLTTVQTRSAANYPNSWNFTDTWTLTSTGPRLQWQNQTNLTITTLSTIDAAAATSIDNTLNGGTDVTLVTSPGSANSGDINVNSALFWASGNTLTLSAYRDVNVNAGISSTGGGNVVLRADNTGNDTGTVNFGANGKVVTDGAVSIYYNPSGLTTATVNGTGILMKDYTNPTDYTGYVRKYTSDEAGDLTAYMLVNNVNQLQAININLFGSYALGKDIDASATRNWNSSAGFTPIGDHKEFKWKGKYTIGDFRGILDGDGHSISGLYINNTSASGVGLFGYVDSGTIRNLGLENVNITGASSSSQYIGGLAGSSSGSIANCYVTGEVSGDGSGDGDLGGLVGKLNDGGTIDSSYSAAVVQVPATSSATYYIGGLVGENDGGDITGSYSSGAVTAGGSSTRAYTGGLVGYNYNSGTIKDSYSSGDVTSGGSYTGGLVGRNINATIEESYSSGAVTGTSTGTRRSYTGGLAGYNFGGLITNCYSTGAVSTSSSSAYTGGLVGYSINGSTIRGSYSAGKVTGSGSYIGGFIGGTDNPDGITASYWDIDSSGQQTGSGDGTSIAGLTGLSASGKAPYSESSYSNFDFGTTWYMIDGSTRPFLKWEYSTTITNAHQLQLMSMDLSAAYTLAANIDMTGYNMARNGFASIGMDSTSAFTGTLDGNGYVVSNLTITGPSTDAAGLFGYIGQSGIVSDIGLYGVSITGGTGGTYVGSLAGVNAGIITNAYSTGKVSGSGTVGGLIGLNSGTVQTSYSTSQVSVTDSSGTAGGLVGENDGKIKNAYSTGKVSGVAGATLGGLVGSAGSAGTISNSCWDTTTSGLAAGVGNGSSAGVAGLTTAQMMDKAYLSTLGFDFSDTWYMVDGSTRPFLRSENVTTITNAHQLQLMGANLSASYTLGSDIDLSELTEASSMWNTVTGFAPVGSSAPFTGALWGNGHTISGLTVNNSALTAVGLFGYIKDAEISRIVLDNANITAGSGGYAGALAGENDSGSITDVQFSGTVASSGTAGGLVGLNTGSIEHSYNTGVISVSGDGSIAGGVAGSNTGTISDCYNAGTVTGSGGNEQVGGVAGVNTGSIAGSYNATGGTVSVSGTGSIAGGVAGSNTGKISDSYNAGTVTGSGNAEQIGGVAGLNTGSITGSYNANAGGVVGISGDGSIAGGVAGSNTGTIAGSYNAAGQYRLNDDGTVTDEIAVAAGAVSGSGTYEQVGGVAGQNSGSITGSTNAGTVRITGKGSAVGGLTGVNTATGTISGSYNVEVKTVASYGSSKPDAVYTAGTVTSSGGDSSVGGLVGENAGNVTGSYSWGPVTATGTGNTVGGLVGWNEQGGSINNSYSGVAAVTASGDNNITGGLVGQNDGGIAYTFAITPLFVSGNGDTAGALIGINGTGGTISNSFWNADISGLSSAVGSGSDDGVTGKTIAEMMQSGTYAGWDLTNTWNIASGYSFPYLSGQYSDYKWWNGQEYKYPTPSFISGIVEGGGTGETVVIRASRFSSKTFSTKTVSASGFYYTLVPAGMAASQQANYSWVVLYITGDSNYKANAVYQYGDYGLAGGNLIKDTLIDNYDGTGSRYGYFDSILNHLPTLPTADSLYSYANGNLVVDGNLKINYVGGSSELDVIDTPLTATGDITITTEGNLLFATKENGDLAASAKIGGYNSHTGAKLTAGGNITIVAGNGFLNNVGADVFNLTGSGRWLVYAPNPLLTQYDLLFGFQDKYIKYLVKTGEQSFWTTYFKTYFGQLLAPSRELVYDGRGGLTGDFVLWGTAYGDAVPATGSGFVYTALDPVIRPLTTGQQQLTAAVSEAYVDDAGAQAPDVPAAASSLKVTIRGQGVAVEPDDSGEPSGAQSAEQDKAKQEKPAQSSTGATTDTGK